MNKLFKMISLFSVIFATQLSLAGGNGNGGGGTTDYCAGLDFTAQSALIIMNDNNDVAQLLSVTRTGINGQGNAGTCNFFFVISNGGAASYTGRVLDTGGGNTVPIQFYKSAGHSASTIIKGATEADTSSILIGTISGTNSTGVCSGGCNYYPYLDTSLVTTSGVYNNSNFDISLYKWDGSSLSSKTLVATKNNVSFKYTRDTSLSLSLVDTGQPYSATDISQDVNFGTLSPNSSPNTTLGFDLILLYTNGYKLSMSSTNGGKIKNTNTSLPNTNNTIGYTLKLNSSVITFTGSSIYQVVKTDTGAALSGGTRLPVSVTIPTVGAVYPGTYSDTVSIQIAAP